MEKIGKYPFMAEPFHCDFRHELFLGHLGNMMLNAADFHSTDRGFGCKFLNTQHKTWVLSRLALEVVEMPQQYDRFFIETWVESAMRYFTNRNFRVSTPEGKDLVWGRSVWAMIDTDTRQPCNIFEVNDGSISDWVEKSYPNPAASPSRVNMTPEATLVREIVAQYCDIDINGHFNSVKYIDHILDLFYSKNSSLPTLHSSLKRVDIAYVAEAHLGDTIRFYEQAGTTEDEHLVRITKITPEGEQECCRASVLLIENK